MKSLITIVISLCTLIGTAVFSQPGQGNNFALVVHGGAGAMGKKKVTPEQEKEYKDMLNEALKAGFGILSGGGTSIDAVEAAVRVLEDSPLFNAGKGAVFTNDGKNEMDAAIMDGKTLKAGAVAAVRVIKNPISAARAVMQQSKHVMMVGRGAEKFATEKGIEIVDTSYFFTEKRWKELQRAKEAEKKSMEINDTTGALFEKVWKYGTVGAVALDKAGNLAAATSTGGMTNKKYGRVGDCPIIGAGTYANNRTCAVSATGHGEYFIRAVVAHDISALMEYKGLSLEQASNEVVMKKLVEHKGEGGIIAIDSKGNIAMPFNTDGMFRGYIKANGSSQVFIYKE